jgi:phage terminase large subunit-like protein
MWDLSCPDWADRIREGRSLIPDLQLFAGEADMAQGFFDEMQLPDVKGMPKMRTASGQWFRDIVRASFGSWDPDNQVRHIRDILAMVPKGSSKTTNGAALLLVAMLMNYRPRGKAFFVGPSQAVSLRAYEQAVGMIEESPDLRRRFKPHDHEMTIEDLVTKAEAQVKTFDLKIMTGALGLFFVLLDEIHVLGNIPQAAKVLRQIRGGLDKTPEGLLVMTTTQSDGKPEGIFKSELKYARNVRDGKYRGRVMRPMLPILYEFPPDIASLTREERSAGVEERWKDTKNWPMVMPNLGRSIHLTDLIPDWESEREKGADAIQVWASQHLNIEIGVGINNDGWSGADLWDSAADENLTLDTLIERSEVIVIGIDGGGRDDLLGLAVMGREKGTRHWLSWCKAWADPVVLERRKDAADTLKGFMDDEQSLSIVPIPQDLDELGAIVARLIATGLLPEKNAVGIDPNNAAAVVEALIGAGVADEQIRRLIQGRGLAPANYGLDRKLGDNTFWHADQDLMAWCVGNAKSEQSGGQVIITKQVSGRAKIDPLVALFQAAMLMSWNPSAGLLITDSDMMVLV